MRAIAVALQKGGSGKTTSTVNLAGYLAEMENSVLVVDMDPQANASTHLGCTPSRSGALALLSGEEPEIVETQFGVDIVVAHEDIDALLEHKCDTVSPFREMDYDWILYDCPPTLSGATLAALSSVDEILVALHAQPFALDGLARLSRNVRRVQRRLNPRLRLGHILMTMCAPTVLCRDVEQLARRTYPDLTMDTTIRVNTRLAEAASAGCPIGFYDSRCAGAEDYRAAAQELTRR